MDIHFCGKKSLTIVLIFLLSVLLFSPKPSYSEVKESHFSNKIGPLLRQAIIEGEVDSLGGLQTFQEESKHLMKVIVVMHYDHLEEIPGEMLQRLKGRIEHLGGSMGDYAFNNVQVWIPANKIEELAEYPEIELIKMPFRPQMDNLASEGIDVIGANYWHNGGLTGNGVKIGVIDLGFKGYEALLGSELPYSVTTNIIGSYYNFISDEHGTACTEIVHDVAPDAQLFLVNVNDVDVDFHNAVSWLRTYNVNIVSCSIAINLKIYCALLYEALRGFSSDVSYVLSQIQHIEDIKDQWNSTINSAVNDGVTWVQAAGNDGQRKWKGLFNDSDWDNYLNFSPHENNNEIVLRSNSSQEVHVLLGWGLNDDFITYDDYDLYITDESGYDVDYSVFDQSRFPLGLEACKITTIPGKKYFIGVKRYQATPQEISLLIGVNKLQNLKYSAPEGTVALSPPADNPKAITVGAVPYYDPHTIEPYCSRGPNEDGIIKPDLVAPDYVSTESYGTLSFAGTSAAAPHTAGVCALVKQAYPSFSPIEIKNYLESNAIDLGPSGKDNIYGSGLVSLPVPSVPPDNSGFGWVNIKGISSRNGTPLCAMVLANGQYVFSCSGDGSYSLDVPVDGNGYITLFAFVDGLSPFKKILTPLETENFDIEMSDAKLDTPEISLSVELGTAVAHPGWMMISGNATSDDGVPLCAMVLANGQYVFSNQADGKYRMEAPLDENGQITLFGFVDGFKPHKKTLRPGNANDGLLGKTEPLRGTWVFHYPILETWHDCFIFG